MYALRATPTGPLVGHAVHTVPGGFSWHRHRYSWRCVRGGSEGVFFLLISGMRDERALSTAGWDMRFFSEALGYNYSALHVLSKKLVTGHGAGIGDKQREARGT